MSSKIGIPRDEGNLSLVPVDTVRHDNRCPLDNRDRVAGREVRFNKAVAVHREIIPRVSTKEEERKRREHEER